MTKGIVVREHDDVIESRAKRAGLDVRVEDAFCVPFEKTLFVEPGTRVPFDLLPAAWHFLERWDAAIPLWKYGVTAQDVGTSEERKVTKAIVRDLRVLLHSTELLFVRRNDAGLDLVETYAKELKHGDNKRLAFLRAMYQVKPKVCVLPTTWLAEVRQASQQRLMRGRQPANADNPLTRIEVAPGRFVKCHKGDEEKVLAHFERQQSRGG